MTRGLISDEAVRFLTDNPPVRSPEITADTVGSFRADAKADFLPRAHRAVERWGVSWSRVEIGGVSCIEILPPEHVPGRTILYCFGGGYVTGSAEEDMIIAAPLAALASARVIAVDYRIAPEAPWPAAVDDAMAVYTALAAAGPFAIAGESAGGNLALVAMLHAHKASLSLPVAALLLSPWCDLTNSGDSLDFNDGRDPTLTRSYVEDAAHLYAGDNKTARPEISPLNGRYDDRFPPMMITTGTRDLLLSQAGRLAGVLREAGVAVELSVRDGLWHVFEFYDELPEAEASLREGAAFLERAFPQD